MSAPGGKGEKEKESRRPADTDFKQQRLPTWQPLLTPHWVISCFVLIAAVFIPIGALVLIASGENIEVKVRYDDHVKDCHWSRGKEGTGGKECMARPSEPECNGKCADETQCGMLANLGDACPRDFSTAGILNPSGNTSFNWTRTMMGDLTDVAAMGPVSGAAFSAACDPKCTREIEFEVTETMTAPVYMYYRLTSFHQNHRIYAKSRRDKQLAGVTEQGDKDCDPVNYPGDLGYGEWCNNNFGSQSGCGGVMIKRCIKWTGERCEEYGDNIALGSLTYNNCGLVTWSMFNDSFVLSRKETGTTPTWTTICSGDAFNVTDSRCMDSTLCGSCQKFDIAYPADRDNKYKPPIEGDSIFTFNGFRKHMQEKCADPVQRRTGDTTQGCRFWAEDKYITLIPFLYNGWYFFEPYHRMPDPVDEDYMVWMRTQTLPTFRKLYRKITTDIVPGTYRLAVNHRFDTSQFSGEKYIVLAKLSWIGGKNDTLGMVYIVVGITSLLTAALFAYKHLFGKSS
eukprot:TRINITY_DN7476_c0_g1_i1.p1 TRINITY_DN7476_c0_g1~~TRINITY_DN7476_c0_g1_i1.p1  ORF type:complete len:543 (+),score=142.79 TRINITY_DN7476_c0_g1_i1:99-1631(+)